MGDEKLKIAICDDEQHIHDAVGDFINLYSETNHVACEIYNIYSGQQLLLFNKEIDMLLLDIDMPEMDGIQAIQNLSSHGVDYKIIMLTSKVDRFKEAFKIGAFRFVTKPIFQKELFEAITDVRKRMVGTEKIRVYHDNIPYSIMQKDILYIMADKDITRIFTEGQDFRSEWSLKRWQKELDKAMFFHCHRSYIVNIGAITEIEKEILFITSGEKIPIARRKRTDLLHTYMIYDVQRR